MEPTFDEMFPKKDKQPSFDEMFPKQKEKSQAAEPGLHAAAPAAKAPLQGGVKWFEDLKQTPVIGPVVSGAENVVRNAGLAGQEMQQRPAEAIPAAAVSAGGGAVGAVEAPAALATNALSNLLIPQGMRTQRNFPQQIAGTPEAQASKVLQQAQAAQPPQYSYNRAVGGVPAADRIAQFAQQEFPNVPGTRATAATVGALTVPVKGLGVFSRAVNNPVARGALEGAGIGELYHLGDQAAHGQPLQPSPVPALGGALAGAGLSGAGAALSKARGRPKVSEIKTEAPTVEKKVVGQVIKPKESFGSVEEATDALYGKSKIKADAAAKFLQEKFAAKQPEPLQGKVEENVSQEEAPKAQPAQALYERIGKAPTEVEPSEEEETPSEWQQRENVPRETAEQEHKIMDRNTQIGRLSEEGKALQVGQKVPFDWNNSNPRRGYVVNPETGRHSQQMIIPSRFGENGEVTHVDLGRKIGKGGASREADALRAIQEGTHVQGQRRAIEFNPEQQHALDRTIEAISNNDIPEAQKAAMQKPLKKYSSLKKEPPSALYADPFMIGPIVNLAKAAKTGLPEAARELMGEDWPETIGRIVKMQDTLDKIEEGANNHGDDIHDSLWHNLAGEALDSRGIKMEGAFAGEAREALRQLSPDEILDPANTPNWNNEQREAIAAKKIYRMDTKQQIKDVLDKHGDEIDSRYKKALQDYSVQQYGYRGQYRDDIERAIDAITGHLYQGFFRWNPAFHALVSTHQLQMGTAIAGIKNIAHANKLMLMDPAIKDFMGSLHNITEDVRGQAAEERFQRQRGVVGKINKPIHPLLEKDIPSGRFNNNRIALAGMLKKGNEMTGDGEQAVRDLANGSLPRAQQLELMVSGLQSMRDATGGGTFGLNRTMLQDSPYLRTLAQLSGYKHIVAKYGSKLTRQIVSDNPSARNTAIKSAGTLLGATILMGGHAVIPKELEDSLFGVLGPERMYGIEKALDYLNVPSKIGINLQDHIQFSLANWGINVVRETFPEVAEQFEKVKKDPSDMQNWANFIGTALLLTRLAPAGIGMATWNRARTGIRNLREGEKKTSVYSTNPFSISPYPVGKGKMDYTIGDFLYSLFAPGVESRIQNFRQKKRITALFKKYGGQVPPSALEQDYPSPGIE